LRLLAAYGGNSEKKRLFRDKIEIEIDSSAKENGFVAYKGYEHEIVRRMGVFIKEV
jgi:hypothetical protein